jgi:hypothetical protein
MQEVPKIVRERLKTTAVANHPDADVLTAFSERSLAEVDRAIVLEHLGLCAECREIVVLALPAEEQASMEMSLSPSHGWLAWPTLRWAFVAAGVVIVSLVGIEQYRQHARSETAVNQPPANFVSTPAPNAASRAPAAAEPARPGSAGAEKREVRHQVTAPAESAEAEVATPASASPLHPFTPTVHGARRGGRAGGTIPAFGAGQPAAPKMKAQLAQDASVADAAPAAEMASALTTSSGGVGYGAENQPGRVHAEMVEVTSAAPLMEEAGDQAIPATTMASTTGVGVPSTVSVAPGSLPTWNISSSGELQRSFNDGKTWEDVDVSDPDALTGRNAGGPLRTAKEKRVKHEKTVFRTVAANGPDIWAGGLDGQLYHSSDAGVHWNRVIPAFSGTVLTGDIIRVVFDNGIPDRILTSTSTPEVWVSTDGGQTWQKK